MINKNNNVNLQLTISKADNEKLLMIQESLKNLLSIDLTKSQTIAFLIRNYQGQKATNQEPKANTKKPKSNINYQGQLNALKDKLNVSFHELSQILGIPQSTLKKYAYGQQNPSGENEKLLLDALKRYGIK